MDFRAKLSRPRAEYWLGLEVDSTEIRQSHISGNLYMLVRFTNCPFFMSLGAHHVAAMQRIANDRGIRCNSLDGMMIPGFKFNAHCKWQPYKEDSDRFGPVLRPDYLSVLGLES